MAAKKKTEANDAKFTPAYRRKLSKAAKARDMGCRAPRCRTKSLGPRFRYFCKVHDEAFSAEEKEAATAAYKARKAKAKAHAKAA